MRILCPPPEDTVEVLDSALSDICRDAGLPVVHTRVIQREGEPESAMYAVPRWAWTILRGAPAETWCGRPEAGLPVVRLALGNPERQAAVLSAYELGGRDAGGYDAVGALDEEWEAQDAWEHRNDG